MTHRPGPVLLFMVLGAVFFAACAADPPDNGASSSRERDAFLLSNAAVSARETASRAQSAAQEAEARANDLAARQTAVRQLTRDASEIRQTDAALSFAVARATATEVSRTATVGAQVKADQAHAQETAVAWQDTRAARQESTAAARAQAAATWIAGEPTRIALVAEIAGEQTRQAESRVLAQIKRDAQLEWQPRIEMFWQLVPPFAFATFLVVLFVGLFLILSALADLLEAHAQTRRVENAKSLILFSRALGGADLTPVGYIVLPQKNNVPMRVALLTPGHEDGDDDGEVIDAEPIGVTRTLFSAAVGGEKVPLLETAPPEPVLDGFIHYAALQSFTREILRTGDWTQETWADKTLPLESALAGESRAPARLRFVLSKNTKVNGRKVPGGYARVMALFVERHLIIQRGRGSTGDWNPNAPRDLDAVMQVLFRERAAPSLPDMLSYPTASGSRQREQQAAA